MKKITRFLVLMSILSGLILSNCKKDPVLPTLSTTPPGNLTPTSATSGGNITDDGGAAISDKGLVWGTSQNPDLTASSLSAGSGAGEFTGEMTSLTENTTYFVRAYATNEAGTAYGDEQSFSTPAATIASVTTNAVTEISATGALSGGTITNDGGSEITAKGICWGTQENPTLENSFVASGTGKDPFSGTMTGLSAGTTYYVRAYATNGKGTAYGNQVSFSTSAVVPVITTVAVTAVTSSTATSGGNITSNGGAAITAKGVCWGTSENPTIADSRTTNGAGNDAFVSNLTELRPETTYYLRAYATNSVGTSYGNQVTFRTTVANPVLTTSPLTNVTPASVTTGGNIVSDGGSSITARGVCWSTTPNPVVTGDRTSNGSGTGTFTSNIVNLQNGTVYYVRAYVTNSLGTFYGNEITFITPVADSDGNIYRTVPIGNQVWMAENLRTTRLNDNTPLTNITSATQWVQQDTGLTPAYSWYQNTSANRNVYGGLYNWFAVQTDRLCPQGWHVPEDSEFKVLEAHLGVRTDSLDFWGWRGLGAGTKLKTNTGWDGDNSSGFDARPGGYRMWINGTFTGFGTITYFWTATDDAANLKPDHAWYRRLDSNDSRIYKATTLKTGGKSIRCVKD